MYKRLFSSLNVNLPKITLKRVDPPKCEDCKHFVPPPPANQVAKELGKCKLLGYYANTCRTHWLSTISCGHEARFFEPK
jgi:hypothetical protein